MRVKRSYYVHVGAVRVRTQGSTQRLSWDGKAAGVGEAGGEKVASNPGAVTAVGGGKSPLEEDGPNMEGEETVSKNELF